MVKILVFGITSVSLNFVGEQNDEFYVFVAGGSYVDSGAYIFKTCGLCMLCSEIRCVGKNLNIFFNIFLKIIIIF